MTSGTDPVGEPKSSNPDDFHRALGLAILLWQKVEHQCFHLYYLLLDAREVKPAAAVFYSLQSFAPKLSVVHNLVRVCVTDADIAAEWGRLHEALKHGAAERNLLAHLTAAVEFGEGNAFELVLAPHLYTPNEMVRPRRRKYDTEGITEVIDEFNRLASAVGDFTGLVARSDSTKRRQTDQP